jgi:hypothetical protein
MSTSFITPNSQGPGNDILERAGDQTPINTTPNFNLDTTATEIIPADTAQ